MTKFGLGVGVVALFVGCTKPNPAVCDATLVCSDPARPFCDLDGAISGTPNSCNAVSCTPGTFGACRDTDALTCNASGDDYDISPCTNGCGPAGCKVCVPDTMQCSNGNVEKCSADGVFQVVETCVAGCADGPPHCATVQPTYMPTICDTPATEVLSIISNSMIDQGVAANCNGGEIDQLGTNAPKICLLRYKTINVLAGTTTRFRHVGSSDPTLNAVVVLVADGDVHIDGTIDVSGKFGDGGGPGAGLLDEGNPSFKLDGTGGGGQGASTMGGSGGDHLLDGGAANAGAMASDPASRSVFYGAGGYSLAGFGGGGIEVVSCHGTVFVTGVINAGGGGGPNGHATGIGLLGGQGGGAGGNIVLEGLRVIVSGGLFANGGGGGGGGSTTFGGYDGNDASASTSCALGGAGGGGAGGTGGCIGAPAGPGHLAASGTSGGGGGGAAGFLQIYTPAGVQPNTTGATTSPALRPFLTVATH